MAGCFYEVEINPVLSYPQVEQFCAKILGICEDSTRVPVKKVCLQTLLTLLTVELLWL